MDLEATFAAGFPVASGPRVVLRGLRPEDRDDVFTLYADKHATRFGYSPKMDDVADADALIQEVHRLAATRELFHWGVASREDDRILGHATLFHLADKHGRAEVGYSIAKRVWGRGLGTETVGVLCTFVFRTLGLRRLEADVDPRNAGSLRVLEKNGFVREGFFRERWDIADEFQDAVMFGLLRREWKGDPRTGDGGGRVG